NTAATTVAPPPSRHREGAMPALLDAAERLLVSDGYARITTRRLAHEAGVNHGLVHYYFGSMKELLVRVLQRFTTGLIARQREMYGAEGPFIQKWRTAWRFHEEDLAAGYPKIWHELQAMAWNKPELRDRLVAVDHEWRAVLRAALARALDAYRLGTSVPPLDALVALVMMMSQGAQAERLLGIEEGHAELLGWIDSWLQSLEERRAQ